MSRPVPFRLGLNLFLICCVAALPAVAGDVLLSWDPAAGATEYHIHYGTSTNTYTTSMPVGNVTQYSVTGLPSCTTLFFAVTASNAAGESGYSGEVSSWARPEITAVAPSSADQGATVSLTITGNNFESGASLGFSSSDVTVNSVSVVSCTEISANVSVDNAAGVGPVTITVTNPNAVAGNASNLFTIQQLGVPSVVATTPADGASNVSLSVQPTVQFSEPMMPSSISSTTVRLLDDVGGFVSQSGGSPSLSGDGLTATIMPAADLDPGRNYRIEVVGGASGVLNLAGQPMSSTFTQSAGFDTDNQVPDTTAPTIMSASAWLSPAQVTVVFSEAMNASGSSPASATNTNNYTMDNGVAVLGASLAADQRTVTLSTSPLASSMTYTLTVNGVTDLAGNAIAANTQTVLNAAATDVIELQIGDGGDDVEEDQTGVSATSGDLELVVDGTSQQTVGMRFLQLDIPQGAVITHAYLQFKTDEASAGASLLLIQGEASDDAGPFGDVASRPRTASSTTWSPPDWNTVGEEGLDQRTPELRAVIQEVVDRPGWVSGNAAVMIITGSGTRTAESFDGDSAGAPLLHVEFALPPLLPPPPPTGLTVQ